MSVELDRIELEAAALDAEVGQAAILPGPGGAGDIAAPVIDMLGEARDLIRFAVGLIVPIYPKLEGVYTADRQEALAQATVPLMEKYGVTMGGIFDKWGAEIRFALVAIPLGMETAKVLQAPATIEQAPNEPAP